MNIKIKVLTSGILVMALLTTSLLAACTSNVKISSNTDPVSNTSGISTSTNNSPQPKQSTFKEPLTAASNDQEITIGDLTTNLVQIYVPGNAFDSPTKLTVTNPATENKLPVNVQQLSAGVEIKSNTGPRLNIPIVITMQIPDKDKYAADFKAGRIWPAYFNGTNWDLFPPDRIDLDTGTISFQSYHLSFWYVVKVPVEKQIENYAHSASLAKIAQGKVDTLVSNIWANVVDMVLLDKLKFREESTRQKILSSLYNDDEYYDLVDQFSKGNLEEFNKNLQIFAGKKIVENIEEGTLVKVLEGVTDPDLVAAAGKAAGYLYEKQFTEAARIMGGQIADSFMITKLVNAAAEVVRYNVDLWKDAEIEAAFNVYKNGAQRGFWGYSVDPGKFDDLWNQMDGITTRLESEAVEREIQRRKDLGMRDASDGELDAVRAQVKKSLEEMFKSRIAREAEIQKEEERIRLLLGIFNESRLLEYGIYGFDSYDTVEIRLNVLFHLTEKILRDTGRKSWYTGAISTENELSSDDIISLAKAWLSTNGASEYAALLKAKFGVDITKPKYILESNKQIVKGITPDTDAVYGNDFGIKPSTTLGPGGGQFYSSTDWGGVRGKNSTAGVSSIGFWSAPNSAFSPGDLITVKLELLPKASYKKSVPLFESMVVYFNKRFVGSVSWNGEIIGDGYTMISKETLTYMVPVKFEAEEFDIEISCLVPGGSGIHRYHYILNPEWSGVKKP